MVTSSVSFILKSQKTGHDLDCTPGKVLRLHSWNREWYWNILHDYSRSEENIEACGHPEMELVDMVPDASTVATWSASADMGT